MKFVRIKARKYQPDITLLLLSAALAAIGLFAIYSATVDAGKRKFVVQLIAAGLGIVLAFFLSLVDFRAVKRYQNHIYILSVLALLFVLFFGSGKEETGANSWIRFFGIGVQPAELVKLSFAMVFSEKLAAAKEKAVLNKPKMVLRLILWFLGIFGLVVLQNDTGTALVFAFMFCVMLFLAGISLKYVFGAIGLAAVALPAVWFFLAPYQKSRIYVFFHPEADPMGAGYQVMISKLAIASGGAFGRGYLRGPQNRLSLLPQKETDIIFGVIGEEFGFFGCLIVVALLFCLVVRCFQIAKNAKDDALRLLCAGLGTMFLFHVLENVCMCLGLLPVTGIPLPFLSYGGSSMVTSFAAVGILDSVHMTSKKLSFYQNDG